MGLPVLPNGRLDRGAALQWYRDNIIPPMLKNGEPNPTPGRSVRAVTRRVPNPDYTAFPSLIDPH